jgi:hypothetical protein
MASTYRNRRRTGPAPDKRRANGSRAQRGTGAAQPAAARGQLAQAARLTRALQALSRGLPNPWDESTDYFRGFTAALPATTKLTAESFGSAVGIGARYQIDLSPAGDVLAALGKVDRDRSAEVAAGFRQLGAVMRATLDELTLGFARGKGVVRVRVWLFGRTEDGALVGLQSISTET